jgi:hypothetical protein
MGNNPTNQFSQLDFETKDDFVTHFGNLRGRVQIVVQAITIHHPTLALQFTYQALQNVLSKNEADQGDFYLHPVHRTTTTQSQTYIFWEASSTLLEWVTTALKDVDNQIHQMLAEMLQQLLRYNSSDPLLHARYVHCLGALSPLYKYNTQALDAVLQRLFVDMQFRLPSEKEVPVGALSEDTLASRKKAHATFINLCKTHAKHLLPNLKALVDKSEELWQKVIFF